jgi:hypothetical protein
MAKREPVFKRGGLVVIGSFAATFAILIAARLLGYQSSFLGFIGALLATHIVGGAASVFMAWRDGQEAYSEQLETIRRWRRSQPSPDDSADYSEQLYLPAPPEECRPKL